MKKHFLCATLFFCALTTSSCSFSGVKKPVNTTPASSTIVQQDGLTEEKINLILKSYKEKKKVSVKETTIAENANGNYQATRMSNIDLSDGYVYHTISNKDKTGTLYKANGKYYYTMSDQSYAVEYNPYSDAYESLGISEAFDLTYTIKDKKATVFLTNPEAVSHFSGMYKNVNMDLGTSYTYNSRSFLEIEIEFTDEDIKQITFNLGYVFGSYFTSIQRTFEFQSPEFKKETIDLTSGNKYQTKTADILDTYVIELNQEYGDSLFVKCGDFDMLIDAGQYTDGPYVNEFIKTYCEDKELDMMVVTHGHGDHIGGFNNSALKSVDNIRLIVDYGYQDGDYYYESYRHYFDGDYYSAYDCVNYQNGASKIFTFSEDLSVEILNTGAYQETGSRRHSDCTDENEHSVVCKLTFKENTYLFTGDISGGYEEYLKQEDIKDITVYKAAHHGAVSHNTNSQSFLNYINPEICVVSAAIVDPQDISVNLDGQYHPTKAFVDRILKTPKIKNSKNLYYNGTMGTIHLSDNGHDLPTVTGLGAKRGYYHNGELVTGEENKKFTETYFYKDR